MKSNATLVTGATGLLGQHVLARLLAGGRACLAAARASEDVSSWERIAVVLDNHRLDPDELRRRGLLGVLECDLPEEIASAALGSVNQVVHVAASTRFESSEDGNPARSNIEGTRRVLEWATEHDVKRFHLVSTAYVGGTSCRLLAEAPLSESPVPRNAYEASKIEAERMTLEWAKGTGGIATIHRPSIIVGEYQSGRTCKFDAFYLLIRAVDFLVRGQRPTEDGSPRPVQLRIEGDGTAHQNIVPVDWVGRMIAGIVADESRHGEVYNLVNPNPPTSDQIRAVVERYFNITGAQFMTPEAFAKEKLTAKERAFHEAGRTIRPYLSADCAFARDNMLHVEQQSKATFPHIDDAAIERMIRYAVNHQFGRKSSRASAGSCADYFERFLPTHLQRSQVARITAMDISVRFVIGQSEEYLCKFTSGRLIDVKRDCPTSPADVVYHATHKAFWSVVSGKAQPQELFLNGEADVHGDIERGLKLAAVLNEFSREFPCDQGTDLTQRRIA